MANDENAPADDLLLGRILKERGLVTEAQLREGLELQRRLQVERVERPPRLGEILVEKRFTTAEKIREALSTQKRAILYCPRCRIRVNVEVDPPSASYRCARCAAALINPPDAEEIKVADSTVMLVQAEQIPDDVQARLQDPAAKFGKYILLSVLGAGGVGVVHKAWDTYLAQYVALKRIRLKAETAQAGMRETMVQSLVGEARTAVRLRHPHIVTIYDIGRIGAEFYMSMEYLDGRTLGKDIEVARGKQQDPVLFLSPKKYMRILRDVAEAVHYAHTFKQPVIHCDLKPSNVFLDNEDRVFVLDFGLARRPNVQRENNQAIVSGTPAYMAPEQAAGKTEDIDARTDVYGLGGILYELLTGRTPFVGNVSSLLQHSMLDTPEKPREMLPVGASAESGRLGRYFGELEKLCMQCLEKEASARPASAEEVARRLDQILKGESGEAKPAAVVAKPVPEAAPDTARYSTITTTVRRRTSWLVSVLSAGLLLAGGALVWTAMSPTEDKSNGNATEVIAKAAAFRPDLALDACRNSLRVARDAATRAQLEELLEEFSWMEVARQRLIAAIDAARPTLPQLKLRTGELKNVQIVKAAAEGLFAFREGDVKNTKWEEIDPAQLAELSDRFLKDRQPADLLGLALLARRSGLEARARELFAAASATELMAEARRYRE